MLAECDNPEVTSSRRSGAIQGVLVVAAIVSLAYALTATSVARGSGTTTTYAGHSVALAALFATAGLALFAAGLLVAGGRPNLGILAVVAGLLWFAPVWEGWADGPALVRTLGMLAASFVFPVLVHVVVRGEPFAVRGRGAARGCDLRPRRGRVPWRSLLVRDPYLDPYCWANCTANVFDIRSEPELARRMMRWQSWITTGCAAAADGHVRRPAGAVRSPQVRAGTGRCFPVARFSEWRPSPLASSGATSRWRIPGTPATQPCSSSVAAPWC